MKYGFYFIMSRIKTLWAIGIHLGYLPASSTGKSGAQPSTEANFILRIF